MEKRIYITAEEREKCRKAADVFVELYEMAEILVLDADRYGFVMLKYDELSVGFAEDETYTDSEELFDALWEEWLNTKLYLMAKGIFAGNCFIRFCISPKVKDLLRIYML